MNNKFYVIKTKKLAEMLSYLTGQKPYQYDSEIEGFKVWSFVNDDKFKDALTTITELMKRMNK